MCKRKGFHHESLFYPQPKSAIKARRYVHGAKFPPRSVHLVARPTHPRNVISPFRAFTISYVACILMHEKTTHRTLFNLSGIHDFFRSVQLVARPTHAQNVISPFRAFTISCVACILIHDQTTHGALFTPFGHPRFRATSCTLRLTWFKIIYQRKNILTARFTYGLLFL